MTRLALSVLAFLSATALMAQLRVAPSPPLTVGSGPYAAVRPYPYSAPLAPLALRYRTGSVAGQESTPPIRPFDFAAVRPHLAFFCRLEINEAAGNVIPAKFRLGGHRYWQDQLPKRD